MGECELCKLCGECSKCAGACTTICAPGGVCEACSDCFDEPSDYTLSTLMGKKRKGDKDCDQCDECTQCTECSSCTESCLPCVSSPPNCENCTMAKQIEKECSSTCTDACEAQCKPCLNCKQCAGCHSTCDHCAPCWRTPKDKAACDVEACKPCMTCAPCDICAFTDDSPCDPCQVCVAEQDYREQDYDDASSLPLAVTAQQEVPNSYDINPNQPATVTPPFGAGVPVGSMGSSAASGSTNQEASIGGGYGSPAVGVPPTNLPLLAKPLPSSFNQGPTATAGPVGAHQSVPLGHNIPAASPTPPPQQHLDLDLVPTAAPKAHHADHSAPTAAVPMYDPVPVATNQPMTFVGGGGPTTAPEVRVIAPSLSVQPVSGYDPEMLPAETVTPLGGGVPGAPAASPTPRGMTPEPSSTPGQTHNPATVVPLLGEGTSPLGSPTPPPPPPIDTSACDQGCSLQCAESCIACGHCGECTGCNDCNAKCSYCYADSDAAGCDQDPCTFCQHCSGCSDCTNCAVCTSCSPAANIGFHTLSADAADSGGQAAGDECDACSKCDNCNNCKPDCQPCAHCEEDPSAEGCEDCEDCMGYWKPCSDCGMCAAAASADCTVCTSVPDDMDVSASIAGRGVDTIQVVAAICMCAFFAAMVKVAVARQGNSISPTSEIVKLLPENGDPTTSQYGTLSSLELQHSGTSTSVPRQTV